MKRLILLLLLITSTAYASDNSKIEVRGTIDDGTTNVMSSGLITKYFVSGARQVQLLSVDGGTFTALTVPTSPTRAKAVLIDVGTSTQLKLKGVTGDVGISLDSTCPLLLPLSNDVSTTTLGLLNAGSLGQQVTIYWF